jgi:hypothetical protein
MTIVLSGVFDALLIVLVVFVALAAAWPGVVLAVVALAASVWWQVTAVHTIERLGDGRFVLRSVARSEEMVPGSDLHVRQARLSQAGVLILHNRGRRYHPHAVGVPGVRGTASV